MRTEHLNMKLCTSLQGLKTMRRAHAALLPTSIDGAVFYNNNSKIVLKASCCAVEHQAHPDLGATCNCHSTVPGMSPC
jgi:hypothetical protein